MSRRGADRWWRPTTRRRPPLRARQRQMFSETEMTATFDTAYSCGEIAERKRHERLEGGLRRLMDAIRESENGDPGPLDDLAREAGVMPPTAQDYAVDPEHLVDEVERWLRDQGE